MKLQSIIKQNSVTFFADIDGARVIVLEARLDSRNDMPRLYRLAKEHLSDLISVMRQAA